MIICSCKGIFSAGNVLHGVIVLNQIFAYTWYRSIMYVRTRSFAAMAAAKLQMIVMRR